MKPWQFSDHLRHVYDGAVHVGGIEPFQGAVGFHRLKQPIKTLLESEEIINLRILRVKFAQIESRLRLEVDNLFQLLNVSTTLRKAWT